jgi:hypothetical protein
MGLLSAGCRAARLLLLLSLLFQLGAAPFDTLGVFDDALMQLAALFLLLLVDKSDDSGRCPTNQSQP